MLSNSMHYVTIRMKDIEQNVSSAGVDPGFGEGELGVANGKCETLRDGETSFSLRAPAETFWLFRLRDRDFKALWVRVRARDVQTLKIRAPDLVESKNELAQP